MLTPPPCRRAALRRIAALLAAPPLLSACGGDDDEAAQRVAIRRDASDDGRGADAPRPILPDAEPLLRVRVATARSGGPVIVGAEDQWLRVASADGLSRGVVLRGPLAFTAGAAGIEVVDRLGFRPALDGSEFVECASIDPRQHSIALDGLEHPGSVRLVWRPAEGPATFDVVNVVPMEHYLPGVLARELYSHWHLQAHMAQAVAARSFAAAEAAWFATRRHYDLTNTTRSQMYGGSGAHRRAIDAVMMTRGVMLGFGDLLVPGYYSSCCGGISADARDAIGENPINDLRPLHGRGTETACAGSPVYAWETTQPLGAVSRGLSSWARRGGSDALADLQRIETIDVSDTNPHGRPTRYAVRGDGGAADLPAERLRDALNDAIPGSRPLRSSHMTVTVRDAEVHIEGRGFGHGVGLCQYGAEALAQRGQTWEQLLQWYYPAAEMVGAY